MKSRRWIIAAAMLGWLAGSDGQAASMASAASAAGPGVCANTPAAALAGVGADGTIAEGTIHAAFHGTHAAKASAPDEAHGYRVASVRWDSLQRQSWVVIASCDHPERPSMTMLMDLPLRAAPANTVLVRSQGSVPIVRAGDLVRLWKIDHDAHIEMVATSEENGAVGARVRVRLAKPAFEDGQVSQPQYFAGIVRGPADVEMAP